MTYIKDTILKANHNVCIEVEVFFTLYDVYQRYNFESKSQRFWIVFTSIAGCMTYIKDTILKANHNHTWSYFFEIRLYDVYQRYNFESKSQHSFLITLKRLGCMTYIKDTILKANHNGGT